jgi:AAA family ATP:ADP antiporter
LNSTPSRPSEPGRDAGDGGRRLLRRLGVELHPGEGATTWLLFSAFFLVVTFQYVVKTLRQSTFIDSLGATRLPYVYLAVALCSYPLLRVYVHFADRVPRHRLISATCTAVLTTLLGFWWLYRYDWTWVPVAFYIWASIAFVMLVSQFWSFSNQALDPRQAKRLFGLIGAGGLLGGIAGGQVARLTTRFVGAHDALLVAAVMLIGVIFVIHAVHRMHPDPVSSTVGATGLGKLARAQGGFAAIRGSRHLQMIATVLVLGVVVAQIIDLQFNWAVEQATTGLSERTAFFGNFFSVIGIAAFAFQLVFTARIHRKLGVGFAMRVLPGTLAVGTIALILTSGFAPELIITAALVLTVGERGIRYSLDQATRELLFLPVPADRRLRAKAFLDVFLQRSAKGLAALLLLPVALGLITPVQAGWLTLGLIAVWLVAIGAAYRAYVGSFRSGLKERSVDTAAPLNLTDLKTVELVIQSLGSPDPRQVLQGLEILEANGRGNLVPPLLLYHDDPDVRQRTLGILARVERRDATGLVEGRLADDHPGVRAEAIRVLTEFHAGDACTWMLPRLQERDPKVRAAAIACLMNHGNDTERRRARATLQDMFHDADAEHRAEAVRAIGAIGTNDFEAQLIRALDDRDAEVARVAIRTVERVVARDGFNPLYLPRIISMLRNRRLKHDAREALVAFGEAAVPVMAYFMNDPGESVFVRRALPKALARVGSREAVLALVDALSDVDDAFLRAQIVEALALRRGDLERYGARPKIEQEIAAEARRYLVRLADVAALSGPDVRFEGPIVQGDTRELNLLPRMVTERLDEHVRTLFGLLAILFPPDDVWAAYRSLVSRRRALRVHALEYLDNTLTGELKRNVFAAIDDRPLPEKLGAAARGFGLSLPTRIQSVERLISGDSDASAVGLAMAGLHTIYAETITELYANVTALVADARDPLVRETAEWVARRLDLFTA